MIRGKQTPHLYLKKVPGMIEEFLSCTYEVGKLQDVIIKTRTTDSFLRHLWGLNLSPMSTCSLNHFGVGSFPVLLCFPYKDFGIT